MARDTRGPVLDVLLAALRRSTEPRQPDPLHDAHVAATDPAVALQLVSAVLTVETSLKRHELLGAARHELRLPLGADSVPFGALHLVRADDSSVVVGSLGRGGSRFRGELVVRDVDGGSSAEYAVVQWHVRDGAVCGLGQMAHVHETIARAVRALDPMVRLTDRTESGKE